jgi:tripartite-type tricarboxylate transporter receptor subunit TctC
MARIAVSIVAAICASTSVSALDFPTRPIKVIVPANAGGPLDVLARVMGETLREHVGQTFIIENKPGANFGIGAQACKNSPPDGYTICLLNISAISINPILYENLGYDPDKDFEPISNLVSARSVFLLRSDVPAKNIAELRSYSQQNADKLNYGSFGVGGAAQLLIEWVKFKTGINMTHVPFTGAAPAMIAFERGDVQVINPVPTPIIIEHIRSGKSRGLFAFGGKRIPERPDVPTAAEAGLPTMIFDNWFGMFAPAGTPRDRVEFISNQLIRMLRDQAFVERNIHNAGYDEIGNTPAEFKASLPEYRLRAEELVKISGIKRAAGAKSP